MTDTFTFASRIARLQRAVDDLREMASAIQDEVARMEAAQARFESREPRARKPRKERRD